MRNIFLVKVKSRSTKLLKLLPALIIIILLFINPLPTVSQEKDFSIKPFKLKKRPPQNRSRLDDVKIGNKKRGKRKAKQGDASFTNIIVGMLGAYDIFNSKFGVETRIYLNTNQLYIPIEWQYFHREYTRVRIWPQIYFTKRKSKNSPSIFASIYSDSFIQDDQANTSKTEVGLGGGFSGSGFNFAVWLTTNVSQGSPTIKELFGIRIRTTIQPSKAFYGMFGMRIGTAIAKGTLFSTSATTFNVELDFGITVWRGLAVLFGVEARTDNLGGLFNSGASITGISDVIKAIAKLGVGYKF